ncbi:MAG: hypothetical protein ABI809_12690, partial [Caldimonas sp.]
MKSDRHPVALALPGLLALAVAGGAAAREEARPFQAERTDAVESCVDGAPIRFRAGDRRVLLDAVDAVAVGAALARRYPVIGRDGLAPDAILLWRKPEAGWLYVTLLANPARRTELCFTATFVAARFELTAPLLVKYFGAGG